MKRNGDWMQTYTGKQFWPMDPRPDDVCIEDIAHALGYLCRFGGHCQRFYSVAEHSVHVSSFVEPAFALVGLLHDASEAYLADVPRPLKPFLAGYEEAEKAISHVIFKHFGIENETICEHVKAVDNAILADEANQVMAKPPAKWYLPEPPLGVEIQCWQPEVAGERFLERYYQLKKLQEHESMAIDQLKQSIQT